MNQTSLKKNRPLSEFKLLAVNSALIFFALNLCMKREILISSALFIILLFCMSFILLKLVQITSGIRISERDQIEGMDLTQHEERAYHDR
tara:strand:+ start:1070 stop:1339 length:270 start_codon:yes stop_codon:yes gene_type:complete